MSEGTGATGPFAAAARGPLRLRAAPRLAQEGGDASACAECYTPDWKLAAIATQGQAAALSFLATSWPYAGEALYHFIEGTGTPLHYGTGDEMVEDLLASEEVTSWAHGFAQDIEVEIYEHKWGADLECGTSKTVALQDFFAPTPDRLTPGFNFNIGGGGLAMTLGRVDGRVSGTVTLTKTCTCSGCCQAVEATADAHLLLDDLYDFCPGSADRRTSLSAYITFLVEQLEACGWGQEFELSADFALPPILARARCKAAGASAGDPPCCSQPVPSSRCGDPPEEVDPCGECPEAFAPLVALGSGPASSATPTVQSCDPNDILGPAGHGDARWVGTGRPLIYTIRFENDPRLATAPAQVVVITHPLDGDLDPRTFRLDRFGFGGLTFEVPENTAAYAARLDLRESLGLQVDVAAGIDLRTGQASWSFRSIDPATGRPPVDPLAGFLPVNDSEGSGEGFVSFRVRPAEGARTDARIEAQAQIVFDGNPPLETPAVFNTLDADRPESRIARLSAPPGAQRVEVQVQSSDRGAGVGELALYAARDGGPFVLAATAPAGAPVVFPRDPAAAYHFFVLATDLAGNGEPMKTAAEAGLAGSTAVGDTPERPARFALGQSFPNPANPTASIPFDVARPGRVALRLYDVLGQRVLAVERGALAPGRYVERLDASPLASGIYFYEILVRGEEGPLFRQVRKLVVAR
ncbi:MAG: T9SS type A sorting domain-containing protein [Candidatus Latescibacterota bacterium]